MAVMTKARISVCSIGLAVAMLAGCSPCRMYHADSYSRKTCENRVDEAVASVRECAGHDPGSPIEKDCIDNTHVCPGQAQGSNP